MRIAFIAHQPDVVFLAEFEELRALVRRRNAAGWITGRIEDDQFCFWRDGFGYVRRANRKTIFRARFDDNRTRAGVLDDIRIADPVRRRHDDFVAGLDEYADDVEDGVLAADIGDTFF